MRESSWGGWVGPRSTVSAVAYTVVNPAADADAVKEELLTIVVYFDYYRDVG